MSDGLPFLANTTSTGHDLSAADWLETHFESARPEYEAALRRSGLKAGDAALDAGCGAGGFLTAMCQVVGPEGSVTALDIAPENVAAVDSRIDARDFAAPVRAERGDVLELPFGQGEFDHIWCANVAQFLTHDEFKRMIAEFRRVAKPGALVSIKEFDSSLMQLHPLANEPLARLWAERRKRAASGLIGPWGGTSIAGLLRQEGLEAVRAKGWLVERWAPAPPPARALVESFLAHWAELAGEYEALAADLPFWEDVVERPGQILDSADFCYREFFVVATGRVPA